jgi:hypothetical protein
MLLARLLRSANGRFTTGVLFSITGAVPELTESHGRCLPEAYRCKERALASRTSPPGGALGFTPA